MNSAPARGLRVDGSCERGGAALVEDLEHRVLHGRDGVGGEVSREEGLDFRPDAQTGALVEEGGEGVALEDCDRVGVGEEGEGAEEAAEGAADLESWW